MAPSSRLLVYQILPTSEIAADWMPFDVEGDYPHEMSARFSSEEVSPGEKLSVDVQTEGKAKVGLGVVDRSVYILAAKRLNLEQVMDRLEELYVEPRIELHEARLPSRVFNPGAKEMFEEVGTVVLTAERVPVGKEYETPSPSLWQRLLRPILREGGPQLLGEEQPMLAEEKAAPAAAPSAGGKAGELAEVERVRQYFPETWLWETMVTDGEGKGALSVTAPDTITEWEMRAVGISEEAGLGVSEDSSRVFQPFFLKVDLPYSCIRGEEFPVEVALYNYLDSPQEIFISMEEADWFELLDESEKVISVAPQEVGSCQFAIEPQELGRGKLKVTARSTEAADAVIKDLLVEPEGVEREEVQNLALAARESKELSTSLPQGIVEGSGRAYLALTASYMAQTIQGLEGLLQMPFGCGEQNMILLAPDIFIAKYLEETGQMKPEVMAKADMLMTTGYQRQLTFRRADGSFSAFGERDEEGSLWLTAFVLKTFSQGKGLMYIDPEILSSAQRWIVDRQKADGSFQSVGFIHHEDMMGGLKGKTALTAYAATALLEAGEENASEKALAYLEEELYDVQDPYTLALVSYALALGESPAEEMAIEKLMEMAIEDENGIHWRVVEGEGRGVAVEATAYGCLALLEAGHRLDASGAARWLVGKRNAFGGFDSTQDTVVGLQALTSFAVDRRADVDLTVEVEAGGETKQFRIAPQNFDVLQTVKLPVGQEVEVSAEGKGELIVQLVKRYNLPEPEEAEEIFHIDVDYDTHEVEVNDRIEIEVEVAFDPPMPVEAGMSVLDISVPTGFRAVPETLEQVVDGVERITRYDVAQRKVIFYVEDMAPGDEVEFEFEAVALYPVEAKGVTSSAYSYYKPQWRGETLSESVVVE